MPLSAIAVTVYLDPMVSARLSARARSDDISVQEELRRAVVAHLAPRPCSEGGGNWREDTANGDAW